MNDSPHGSAAARLGIAMSICGAAILAALAVGIAWSVLTTGALPVLGWRAASLALVLVLAAVAVLAVVTPPVRASAESSTGSSAGLGRPRGGAHRAR